MRNIATMFLAGALFLGAAGSALASGGSTYVTSSCDYASLQDNSIFQGDLVYVWIKTTGSGTGPYTWSTIDNPGGNFQEGDLTLEDCTRDDGKYQLYQADGFDSSVTGSYQLTVWDWNGQSVSGDGFRVVPGQL
jgi:hypothetical protein